MTKRNCLDHKKVADIKTYLQTHAVMGRIDMKPAELAEDMSKVLGFLVKPNQAAAKCKENKIGFKSNTPRGQKKPKPEKADSNTLGMILARLEGIDAAIFAIKEQMERLSPH